jgi:DNA-binding PadR family transcriptional regulator
MKERLEDMSKHEASEAPRAATEADIEALVPLPRLAYQILLALAKGEGHGYAIAKEVERNTDGRTKPSTGSLYLSMEKLHTQALIEETEPDLDDDNHDARRRYFRITMLGRQVARAETERMLRLVNLARERDLLSDAVAFARPGEAKAQG